jgi:hypothetical protein
MKNFFNKSIPKKRVVFRSTIELNSNYREKFNPNSNYHDDINKLKPDKGYYFGNKEEKVSYEKLKVFLTDTLENELLSKVNDLLDTPILGVKINSVNEGSIEIVFTILVNAYQYIASISDFLDSVSLIKDTAKNLLKRKLNQNYGDYFDVDVYNIAPSRDNIERHFYGDMKHGRVFPLNYNDNNSTKRDGFFYYLLFSNIVLTVVVILLIWKAVITTYGW